MKQTVNQQQNFTEAADYVKPKRMVKCTIKIDDRSYRLASDGSVEELKFIGQLINKKIKDLKDLDVFMDKNKLYLTTALQLAEDYARLLQNYADLQTENKSLRKMLAEQQKASAE
ncbi:MAG: cell division protein ZapA [Bacillota bacterium]|jgi:cell division protein ZapA (FtsZ GTPase activity inhibitor)